MGKKHYILIGIVFILLGGGLAFWLITRDKDDKNSQTSTGSNSSQNQAKPASGTFSAVPTTGASYLATITITTDGKQVSKSTMAYDKGSGAIKYEAGDANNGAVIYYTSDALYMCQEGGTCYKYPVSQSGASGFNPSTYEYDQAKLDAYKDKSTYQGSQSCPAGTCDVWKVANENGDLTIYIDQASKRVSKVTTNITGGTSDITFDYSKQVTVTPPPNAQSLPSLTP